MEQTFIFKDDLTNMAISTLSDIREKHRKHRNVSKKMKGRKIMPNHIDANSNNGKKLKRSEKLRSELIESVNRGGFKSNLETVFVGIHWR